MNEIEKIQEEPDKDEKRESGLSTDTLRKLEFENVKGAKKGCIRCEFGPYYVYITFKEEYEGKYVHQVFIPSLQMWKSSTLGFQLETAMPLRSGSENGKVSGDVDTMSNGRIHPFHGDISHQIPNHAYQSGKSLEYMKNLWCSLIALINPIFCGDVPLTHNTPVDVSFNILKHYGELWIDALRRPGGIPVAEYFSRAASTILPYSHRVARDLIQGKRVVKRKPRSKNLKKPKTKTPTISERAKKNYALTANQRIVRNTFMQHGKDGGRARMFAEPAEDTNAEKPATQTSQIEASNKEENWSSSKRRKNADPVADANFVTLMKLTRDRFFGGWTSERIVSFLEDEYLSKKGLKFHKSLSLRVYS